MNTRLLENDSKFRWSLRSTEKTLSGTLAMFLLASACGSQQAHHVKVVREVFIEQGKGGTPSVITPTKDGGYVIAGDAGAAWATRVNAQGTVIWRYMDSRDETRGGPSQSQFAGAVMLADDSVVLCGHKYLAKGEVGLLVRLSATGAVLNNDYISASEETMNLSGFTDCLKWGDGVAVLGFVPREPKADGWLIKLDGNGKREWEVFGQDYLGHVIAMADHSLVLAREEILRAPIQLTRIDGVGHVLAKGSIPCEGLCGYFTLLRTPAPSSEFKLAILNWPHAVLHSLDLSLKDVKPPITTQGMATNCGYGLTDGTALLFGQVEKQGAGSASIGQVNSAGKFSLIHVFEPLWSKDHRQIEEESIAINDAVATSTTEFVTVRSWAAGKRDHVGIYLDWISIE
jgi:hypothetical protein